MKVATQSGNVKTEGVGRTNTGHKGTTAYH